MIYRTVLGGTMGVKSTVGVGSELWIELIRGDRPQLAAQNIAPAEPVQQAPDNAALSTLLYVEDNPANLLLVDISLSATRICACGAQRMAVTA